MAANKYTLSGVCLGLSAVLAGNIARGMDSNLTFVGSLLITAFVLLFGIFIILLIEGSLERLKK